MSTTAIVRPEKLIDAATRHAEDGNAAQAIQDAAQALALAAEKMDLGCLAAAAGLLRTLRSNTVAAALEAGVVHRINEADAVPADDQLTPGCYLFEPMLVGANARELRDRAEALGVPVLVLAREPGTQTGLWPVVMLGPVTVRTYVRPPADNKPTPQWLLESLRALGHAALERADAIEKHDDRIAALAELLQVCPEHDELYEALMQACTNTAPEPSE